MYLTQSETETGTIYFVALNHSMNDCWTIFNDFKGLTDIYWGWSHTPLYHKNHSAWLITCKHGFQKQQHQDRIQKVDWVNRFHFFSLKGEGRVLFIYYNIYIIIYILWFYHAQPEILGIATSLLHSQEGTNVQKLHRSF